MGMHEEVVSYNKNKCINSNVKLPVASLVNLVKLGRSNEANIKALLFMKN